MSLLASNFYYVIGCNMMCSGYILYCGVCNFVGERDTNMCELWCISQMHVCECVHVCMNDIY